MEIINKTALENIGRILNDKARPMKERFRALFTLRNIGGEQAVKCIENCFSDTSSLLKHECAYCLGQMRNPLAVPKLESILQNSSEEPIVRHEAGEALAAIGLPASLYVLKEYCDDPVVEVAETCKLAVRKIELQHLKEEIHTEISPYNSVDPAPPFLETKSTQELKTILLDETLSMFERYRAMFSLRNSGTTEAVLALAEGFKCQSALFKHEIAYVLGQMQNSACEKQLTDVLFDLTENEMVRHECAEALGSIASPNCDKVLRAFLNDNKRVVRESCEVALDMCDYENSTEFQYADSLSKAII